MPCIIYIATSYWQMYEQLHDLMFLQIIDASMWLLIQSSLWKKLLKIVELNRLNWSLKKLHINYFY